MEDVIKKDVKATLFNSNNYITVGAPVMLP